VVAQTVQLVRVGERNGDLLDSSLQLLQFAEQEFNGFTLACRAFFNVPQLAIPTKDPRTNPELVKRRSDAADSNSR